MLIQKSNIQTLQLNIIYLLFIIYVIDGVVYWRFFAPIHIMWSLT